MLVLLDVRKQNCRVERTAHPKGSLECSAALRHRKAFGGRMQMSTTTVRTTVRVGKQGSVDRDDTQQV